VEKLSYKSIFALIALVSMIATIAVIPSGYAQNGPIMDILRHEVIRSPDAALIAMQTDQVDFSPEQIRTPDIEKLDSEGNLITQDLGFHMGFIGYNIRDIADGDVNYGYRPELIGNFWPLADVNFRKALIRGYDQLGIIPPIYGYIVTPVRSLVPPAQSKYYYSAAQSYPYNPGNPFAGPDTTSTCGILKTFGYTFVDAGTIGVVDNNDYWKMPNGEDMVNMRIFTPLIDVAPTSFQHGAEFVADLRAIGLAGTTENGGRGLVHEGRDFNEYLNLCYGTATAMGGQFDAFMVFYSLGRLPDQLYDLMHSSSDTVVYWGRRNAVGINNPDVDALTEVVKYSLDPDVIEGAAKTLQDKLYDTSNDWALAYMLLYSRSYFTAFTPGLDGIVKSPGYGADNSWTYLNAHWLPGFERTEDGNNVMIYVNGDEPDSFNYNFATTVYEWNIIGQTVDGLTAVNPYNHADIPWLASDWEIVEVGGGMDIVMTLRSDVEWQDGFDFSANDVEWCLEFMRDMEIPRYFTAWQNLIDVVVTDATHLTIQLDAKGLSLFYDVMGVGALLAPQIWDRNWVSNQEVLDWIPTGAYTLAPGYTPPVDHTPTPTNVMGTGPFIFDFYDTTNLYDDMHRNPSYFMTQAAVTALMTSMFWQVGDEDYGGLVNAADLTQVSFAYGARPTSGNWNADANFDLNAIIDIRDLGTTSYHLTWQKFWTA
jgi:ABC-type transport system substrate-binding protein